MKKKYSKPATDAGQVTIPMLLASSDPKTYSGELGSRRRHRSSWDDEEEEELEIEEEEEEY